MEERVKRKECGGEGREGEQKGEKNMNMEGERDTQ